MSWHKTKEGIPKFGQSVIVKWPREYRDKISDVWDYKIAHVFEYYQNGGPKIRWSCGPCLIRELEEVEEWHEIPEAGNE